MIARSLKILSLLWAMALPLLAAESDDADHKHWFKRCINSRAIRATDVVSDRAIVFRMRGGDHFINELPTTCRGLSEDGRIVYDLHTRSLCARDSVRILREAGSAMYGGRACKLGQFRRLTEHEVEIIYAPQQ